VSTSAVAALAVAGLVAPAATAAAPKTWPPVDGPGQLFVHYGEEHLDDADGPRIFPKVIADSIRFRPDVVITAADKSSDGTEENLNAWKAHMSAYDRAGIPYFPAVGNHDREALPGFPEGVSPFSPLGPYVTVFADRPYPFGDAPPPSDSAFSPRRRADGDPDGASSHYAFDYGRVRWVILDNSCFSFTTCDGSQNPPFPDSAGNDDSYEFLATEAADAARKDMLVFVNMHMPTQDPRPEHVEPTPGPHNMGEGSAPDNATFEQAAAVAGVDGVFVGHIKGQWVYTAQGVPYFIDGGAGGEVYVGPAEEVGVDYGYWHGFRLVRVADGSVVTDAVPIFVPGGITVKDPGPAAVGDAVQLEATGRQPTEAGPIVDALELREPDRGRPNAANLPTPARIWTTGNRLVLAPARNEADDPRRDRATQTMHGRFAATCAGRARVTITAGVESAARRVTVRSKHGRLVRRIARGARRLEAGRSRTVARVRLAQPAVVEIRIERRGRLVERLVRRCAPASARGRWDGRNRAGRRARAGRYTVEVAVRSDRRPVVRRFRVRLVR
jgi:hypothetical protein